MVINDDGDPKHESCICPGKNSWKRAGFQIHVERPLKQRHAGQVALIALVSKDVQILRRH